MTENYEFDDRLELAETLPSRFYTEADWLRREEERVFGASWQLAGRVEQLPEAGSFLTTVIAGEPVILLRNREGELAALSNVCRHRGGPVATGAGKRPLFQCGYHGWTYSLDGQLRGTPEFEGVAGFDRSTHCLPRFRIATVGQLIFVKLTEGGPELSEVFGDVAGQIGEAPLREFGLAARKEWEIDCNWKVYVDNYLEGYHIPIVHPALFRELDYANYRTETRRWFSIQHSPIRRPERLRAGADGGGEAKYFWIFPNLMVNVYPDNFSTNLILPLGHERTLTLFEWYFRQPLAGDAIVDQTVEFSDEIQIEDIEICEAVQRGLRSRTYDRGRYSAARENGVHHFHGLYADSMGIPRRSVARLVSG
jgi:choline monooxygenase